MILGRLTFHVYINNHCEVLSSALLTVQVDHNKEDSSTTLLQKDKETGKDMEITAGLYESFFPKMSASVSLL